MNKEKITVIIPTKNEEASISEVIKDVKKYADEILVIDAHSKDNTRMLAEKEGAKIILDNKKGIGYAKRIGIKNASNEIMVFIDADLSHDPKDIPKLIEPIKNGKYDLVLGSRMTGGSDELHGTLSNFIRNFGAGIIQLIINYRWNIRLTDCENGFRAIKKSVAQNLNLKAKDFDIEEEMVIKCLKKGYLVTEVPTHEYERKYGKSRLSLPRMGYKFIWRLLVNII